ncbi:MAG: adenylate/guanylate cyclase domain-containing protein [Chloroflexi bacterium]|nr:adenylate/guanylate cyclase domain-containing protein [Chloroflexota bacterium]
MASRVRDLRKRAVRLIFTPQQPLRRVRSGLIVGVIVGTLVALAVWQDMFTDIRTGLTDRLYNPRPTTGLVAIVAIDDASLAAYGRSTTEWSRSVHADLINQLSAAGARVIAFDVLFANPSDADPVVAEAATTARNIVLAFAGSNTQTMRTTRAGSLINYDYYTYPTDTLKESARMLGHVNVVPDGDGQIRQIPLFIRDGEQVYPTLGLAAYMQYLRLPPDLYEISDDEVEIAKRKLYIDSIGQMLIYYFGPPSSVNVGGTFPVYSFVDVAEGRVPPDAFEGKIVLVGVMGASGDPDSYATPSTSTGEKMFGVEIHANVIETIHQSLPTVPGVYHNVNWKLSLGPLDIQLYRGTTRLPLRPQPYQQEMIIVFLLAVVGGMSLRLVRWYIGALLGILVYMAYFAWASASFTVFGRVLDLFFPAVAVGFTYVGTVILSYVFEERRRGQINDLFSRYVSAEIAQKIVEAFDQGKLELGGEEREITVLFADIRGFTTLSEGLTPPEVVRMLNLFLEDMTNIVMQNGGAINKYIGDNLMAFWNAPYPQNDHAWLATKAALEMLESIRLLNTTGRFHTQVQFGIGVNTGPVVVGNIGSSRRLEYTPIGDTVNTASRMCGVAPGGTCYVGTRTRELVGDRVKPVQVHHLKLKGKAEPVEIHELRLAGSPAPAPVSAEAAAEAS